MQISQHHLPYQKRTLIVVTNNESAKIYNAFKREVIDHEFFVPKLSDKIEVVDEYEEALEATKETLVNGREELYKELAKALLKHVRGDFEDIILCAPEINKNILMEALHPEVREKVGNVISKNLASLPLDQAVRILQETRQI